MPRKVVSASASEDVPVLISHIPPLFPYGSCAVHVRYTVLACHCSLVC
jgi:hypothetical protein